MNIRPDFSVDLPESVEAGVLIRQGGADPRLRVAHLPPEVAAASEMLQRRHGLAQLLHGVSHLLHAVIEGALLPPASSLQLGKELRCPADVREADPHRHLRQLSGAAGGAAVRGERPQADVRVAGVDAGSAHQVVFWFIGGGGEQRREEENEQTRTEGSRHFPSWCVEEMSEECNCLSWRGGGVRAVRG